MSTARGETRPKARTTSTERPATCVDSKSHKTSDYATMSHIETMTQRFMKPVATKDDFKEMKQDIATVNENMV